MKKSRFSAEQIIGFIKQADAGMAVAELCHRCRLVTHGLSSAIQGTIRPMENQDHRTRVAAQRRERMRSRLLSSTLELIAAQGPSSTSIDDVIAAAGVGRRHRRDPLHAEARLRSRLRRDDGGGHSSSLGHCGKDWRRAGLQTARIDRSLSQWFTGRNVTCCR